MQSLPILHFSSNEWVLATKHVNQCIKDPNAPELQYLFLENDVFSKGSDLAPELSHHFQIPKHLFSDVYRRSNGFFSSAESRDKKGQLQSCSKENPSEATWLLTVSEGTWFRVLIKAVLRDDNLSYTWHEMTFCSRWDNEGCSILCIGVDCLFQNHLQETLSQMWSQLLPSQPYSLHVPIIETIIAMQDLSVWSIRDVVRSVEQDRSHPNRGPRDFLDLHEASRHAIHSFETLSVAVETLGALQQHISRWPSGTGQGDEKSTKTSHYVQTQIDSQVRMLRNLLLRSQSNKDRLQNEIALAYNMIAQRDSQVMKRVGEAARLDSRAMRTIAVVTMAFLPPTFLSTIFSMSFFNYAPGQGNQGGEWSISNKFWIYWAFAVPLTFLTLVTWFWRQKQQERQGSRK